MQVLPGNNVSTTCKLLEYYLEIIGKLPENYVNTTWKLCEYYLDIMRVLPGY